MSWNAALYYYHLSRGGDYFGLPKEGWESSARISEPRSWRPSGG